MRNSIRLDQASKEDLNQLAIKYRRRTKWLIVTSVLFAGVFALSVLLMKETIVVTLMQGLFLAVGFVFVTFISDSEKKLRAVCKHRK